MSLEGKVAIVTGAVQGIGRAIAMRFLRDGAKVVIADIDDHADAAIADLKATGDATFIHCDVGERLDVRNLVASTLETYGDINILVNNAGILHQADFLDLKEDDFDAVLRVNLKGPFLCGQQVARHMVEQVEAGEEPGSIINISSVNAVLAITDQVPYSISKAGLRQLTNVMALALAPHGIRVNAIGPGTVLDDTAEDIHDAPDFRRVQLSRTPMGRMGEPHEIAAIAAFLASDAASYLTGQTIYADGGRMGLNYTVPVDGE